METNEIKEIKVIVREIKTQDGKRFNKYLMVDEHDKLVELRFRKETDLSILSTCKKAKVQLKYLSNASDYYEYPRYYGGEIVSVEKIY